MTTRRTLTLTTASALAATFAAPALGQSYDYDFQRKVGGQAAFHVHGPATEGDLQGDAFLSSVEMPGGETFDLFYRPVAVTHLTFDGDPKNLSVRGGDHTTGGFAGVARASKIDEDDLETWGVAFDDRHDGDDATLTAVQAAGFQHLALTVLKNRNLNNYFDVRNDDVPWSIVIEFDLVIKDNDPVGDAVGELLYFERGADYGNSWITLLAVDEDGNALPGAQPLAISPSETQATTPAFSIYRDDQQLGAAAIDVSRLGVTEFKHLKVSSASAGVGGYTGGETQPDYKFMAVVTDQKQITQLKALYD